MRPLPALLLLTLPLTAQPTNLVNAKLETKSATNLQSEITAATRRPGPLWIGWTIPQSATAGNSCCTTSRDGQIIHQGCALEPGGTITQVARGPIPLEAPTHANIFLRIENGAVSKIRFYGADCSLDAGGRPVIWLNNAKPADSINYLASYVRQNPDEHRKGGAIAAIAIHDDPQADRVLNDFVQPSQPDELRRSTVFWLGNSRGKSGFEAVLRVLKNDPSTRVREQAVFALTLTKDPRGIDTLIETAKTAPDAEIRSKALFWMAQKAGRKAVGEISAAVRNDPNTKVKRQAVFALSRLPADQGIPALIEVARNNKNPEVRKQAFFWLGQSKDPRATKFLEQVLTAAR